MKLDKSLVNQVKNLEQELQTVEDHVRRNSNTLSQNRQLYETYSSKMGFREKYLRGLFGGDKNLSQQANEISHKNSQLERELEGLNSQRIKVNNKLITTITQYLREYDADYQQIEQQINVLLRKATPTVEVTETDLSFFGGTYAKSMKGRVDNQGHLVLETVGTDLSFFDGRYPKRLIGTINLDGEVELQVSDTDLSFFGGRFPKVMHGSFQTEGSIIFNTTETDLSFFEGTYVKRMEGDLFSGNEMMRDRYMELQAQKNRYVDQVRSSIKKTLI